MKSSKEECVGCKFAEICKSDCNSYEKNSGREIRAIILCLILPCILFLSIVIVIAICKSALMGCVLGLISLAVYFGLFYLFKNTDKEV